MVPIPGTTKIDRMKENACGAQIQLTPKELQDIQSAGSQLKAVGERYPEALQKRIDREI